MYKKVMALVSRRRLRFIIVLSLAASMLGQSVFAETANNKASGENMNQEKTNVGKWLTGEYHAHTGLDGNLRPLETIITG